MVNDFVEVIPKDFENDWVLIKGDLYHSKHDTQHILKKRDNKYFLEAWYIYHHFYLLKTIDLPNNIGI